MSVIVLAAVAATGPAQAADRVALVLSVEDYRAYGKSEIPGSSIVAMGRALAEQGFEVDIMTNANNAVARATLRDFAGKADGARAAIIILAGHGLGARGQFYLLPSNAEIGRASDLFSRALAVSSVAHLVSRAKHGAVFFFTSAADIPSTVDGVTLRPDLAAKPADNVVVTLSTSQKVPVSRIGAVSRQAAADFAEAAAETPMMLSALVAAAAAGEVGSVFGSAAEVDLSKGPEPPASPAAAAPQPSSEEIAARRAAEERADEAEARAREAEARAREAEARATEEASRAREAESAAQAAAEDAAGKDAAAAAPPPDIDALKLVEALLGRSKKKLLQRRMRDLGFYGGPIDSIFGDLTREGIRAYQASIDEAPTGYLTPAQIQRLVEG